MTEHDIKYINDNYFDGNVYVKCIIESNQKLGERFVVGGQVFDDWLYIIPIRKAKPIPVRIERFELDKQYMRRLKMKTLL